ncbi:pancreas transcription factor 1 subunit alpha [Drosophila obscura]|uniref:pancreas transcription factor 1 subunit alpha n=1 Tax=Drosophila obscura TaxID=7282 RepID=UPI001BB1BF7E|nr:pancreas transcription factor 1 subunit alpha [Drosophila obscura]
MPRKKRSSSPLDFYDEDFDEDASSQSSQPPVQRNAANARERMRMRVLSSAYGRLKTKLPNIPPDTKLSKLDTLRLATLYIKQLITAVETGSHSHSHSHSNSHSNSTGMDALDTSHMPEPSHGCGSGGANVGGSVSGGNFHFHNGGHSGMSWPFEFHQSNRSLPFGSSSSSRMDWQSLQAQSYPKSARIELDVPADLSYAQLQDSHGHWYPSEMHQMELTATINGCAYETATGMGQHQRGIAIASHAHNGL